MFRKPVGLIGLILLALLMLAAGAGYRHYLRPFVSTDDAYVTGHVGVISPRVSGRVAQVLVDGNQNVKPGQTLLTLDPKDCQVAVAQAEANLARLRRELAQRYVKVATTQARVTQADANFRLAGIDRERYKHLYERHTISKNTLDKVVTHYQVTRGELEEARQVQREALAALGGSAAIPLERQPAIKKAQAQLEQARLNLSYTRVVADISGYITRRQVQPGNMVKPGQPLMMLVPLQERELWIEANFKETQLTNVCLGQPAMVQVDTYPQTTFRGRVHSIMSGAAFSLLPPENATDNWVEVVQRIPVKIALEPPLPANQPLRLGMSTTVTIDTRESTGKRLLSHREPAKPGESQSKKAPVSP